ncbi:hypothetical protein VE01_05122 [Pseudogymnoascus verrucosus]|uniref:SWIRM domain-containing protein n=1 Tax=Pseudogymnoascus verrucosus TaxID=342668 RepID=A0A1B8GI19_9PEZI|nr:uncharacterized protein VE01_05122 [Pseudogymnoascus verrucosus]OBT95492.1 hypothetical protein VE01_05122 [Pseudogymnoascus verrucosus]
MATNNPHKHLAMSALMSPPEATPYDRFPTAELLSSSPSAADSHRKSSIGAKLQFLSPPVSPDTPTTAGPSSSPTTFDSRIRDPILYPPTATESDNSISQPLFAPPLQQLQPPQTPTHPHDSPTNRLVDQHISRAHRKNLFRATSPPNRSDYILTIEFHSQVMRNFTRDPDAYLARERQFLMEAARRRAAAAAAATSRSPAKSSPRSSNNRTYPALAPSPAGVSASRPRAPPKPRAKPRRDRTATPDAPSRSRNTGTSTREDKEFHLLPDLCPAIESRLRPNALKVEWKGAPLDLSADPHRALLDPEEVSLAANLRLDCATYLTSKRRIFVARRECWAGTWGGKGKKEFRKTDAQQACKIDVNKASKLWMAFEKVGWLDEKWCV